MTDNDRPLILIDVDGVLNRTASAKQRKRLIYHEGWLSRWGYAEGQRHRLLLLPAHGPMLLRLAEETGAELAWGTTWNDLANNYAGPHLGLPELPVATVECGRKADGVIPWTDGRPFVWFDDEPYVAARCAELTTQPHLVVLTDENTGLTDAHIEQARVWLSALTVKDPA